MTFEKRLFLNRSTSKNTQIATKLYLEGYKLISFLHLEFNTFRRENIEGVMKLTTLIKQITNLF
jgi:hypothetical protein